MIHKWGSSTSSNPNLDKENAPMHGCLWCGLNQDEEREKKSKKLNICGSIRFE